MKNVPRPMNHLRRESSFTDKWKLYATYVQPDDGRQTTNEKRETRNEKLDAIAGKKSPAFLRGRLLQGYLLFASASQT
jgi:hypothetical protein